MRLLHTVKAEALLDRIISYRIAIFCVISYRVPYGCIVPLLLEVVLVVAAAAAVVIVVVSCLWL